MRRVLFTLPLLAGIASAIVLTMPSVARAWDIHSLPDGYEIVGHIKNGDCTTYQIRGYGAAIDLSDCRPDFQEALDAWVEQTCPQAVCHPAPPTTATTSSVPPVTTAVTTTAPPVTTTAPTDTTVTTAPVTTTVPPVTTDTTPVTTTSAAPPVTTTVAASPAQTVTVTTVITDPAITSRLDLIEQRQATDEARITQLENPPVAGAAPLGEPKNLVPFVAA